MSRNTRRALLPARGLPFLLDDGSVLRASLGTVLYLGLVALLSFGLAAAIRHTGAALVTVLALLYLAPILAGFVADERWHARIDRYAPMTAGLAIQATTDAQPIAPWTGLAILSAHTGAALLLGAALFARRDTG